MTDMSDSDEPDYYAYSATLRIHGPRLPLDAISKYLGIEATHQHRRGEKRRHGLRPYNDDAWHLTAPVAEERELTHHLRELWRVIKPHVDYLNALNAKVDVFCGYRSNNGAAGFAVEPDALEIFTALRVPFGVSVIIDSWLGQRLDEPTLQ
jgi:hypothetical protein